jgi:hypothetical protein
MSVAVSFLSNILQSLATLAKVLPSISLALLVKELKISSKVPHDSPSFFFYSAYFGWFFGLSTWTSSLVSSMCSLVVPVVLPACMPVY